MVMSKVENDLLLESEVAIKILEFCRDKRYLYEIANFLNMDKNEVRSSYLYPLIRAEKMMMVNTKFRSR